MQKIKKLFIASLFIFGSCSAETLEEFRASFNMSCVESDSIDESIAALEYVIKIHRSRCIRYKYQINVCPICFHNDKTPCAAGEEIELREGAILELIAELQGTKRV